MGNQCSGDRDVVRDVIKLSSFQNFKQKQYMKSQAQSIRLGDIIRSKSSDTYVNNSYNFNLSIKQSFDSVNVKCPVVTNYSDMMALKIQILNGIDNVRLDHRNVPIIDHHDFGSNRQILHKFVIRDTNQLETFYTVKAYQFQNYHDIIFKSGIYEAYLYQTLNRFSGTTSFLQDVFILEKGIPMSLVFVFNSYLYSLEDILIYRKQANLPYTQAEQTYIAHQIISRYLILQRNSIVHRDIRPSKIYLSQSTNPMFRGYEFQNLQSARKLMEKQKISLANNNTAVPMTARGVPAYCSGEVANFVINDQQFGIYDPWRNDRNGLAKTIAMLVTLNYHSTAINYEQLKLKNQIIYNVVSKLDKTNESIQNIEQQLNKSNLQSRLTVIDTDYNICLNYLPKLLRQQNKQRIQASTTQILFALDLKQQYTHRLDKMISQNYRNSTDIQNISILNRLGRHLQGKGMKRNDYYLEEMNLLLDLCQNRRKRGYEADHLLQKANQIFTTKFDGRTDNDALNADIKIQNAYNALRHGNMPGAANQINSAYLQASQSRNIPVRNQIKLLQAKGFIENFVNGPAASDPFFIKGLELSNNRQNFITEVQMLDSKSTFQSLLGQNLLRKLQRNRSSMSPQQYSRQLAQCQNLLSAARNTKIQIPQKNTLPLALVHQSLGDLQILRQDYRNAEQNYKKSYRFMNSMQAQISDNQKVRMLDKTYQFYQRHSDNYADQERIKNQIISLKGSERDKKEQRKDRNYFKKIRYWKQQMKKKPSVDQEAGHSILQVDQIQQQDHSKRLIQSNFVNELKKNEILPQTAIK